MNDELRQWAQDRVFELAQVEDLLQNWGKWCVWYERIGPVNVHCKSIERRFVARYPGHREPSEAEPINAAAIKVEKIMRHVPKEYKYALLDYYGVFRGVEPEETRLRATAQVLRTNVRRAEKRLEIGRTMVLNLLKRNGVELNLF